jgi:hypothetical protein
LYICHALAGALRVDWLRPRQVLVICAGGDLLGVLLAAGLIDRVSGSDLLAHPLWWGPFGLIYVFFSWLFGSYTLLRWPRLPIGQVLVRLGAAALATTFSVVLAYWLLNLPESFTLGHRRIQLLLLSLLSLWALGLRLLLRWRVRVEDVAMSTLPVAQLNDTTQNFSAWSTVRTLTLTAPATAPGQVQNVIASDGSFQDSVRLLWKEQALAEFYDVRRSTTNNFGTATLVQTLPQGTNRYFDTSAPVGPTLYYWIVARNSAGSASPSAVETGIRGAASSTNYFPQSVASGAPRPASVVLWTRVWDEALPTSDRQVSVQVATDSAFTNVVFSRNDLQARAAHDHCVKLTVTDLQPHTTYWYRFQYLKAGAPNPIYSRTGRTRTGRSRPALAWAWEKSGIVTSMHLPLVPQQHHGKAKNHPQNGAANIVHEDFSGVDEGNSRVNSPGLCLGTGSKPPSHQG